MPVIRPEKWGPNAWRKFHIKALTYPVNPNCCDIDKAKHFYNSGFLKFVECDTCASHYRRLLREIPIDARSMLSLFRWSVDIHNRINIKLHRQPLSYCQAFNYWIMVINESYPRNKFYCQNIPNPFGQISMSMQCPPVIHSSSVGPIPASYFVTY